jgi:alpha-ketoglutarate-dependent taurine dioxygenase
MAPNDREPAIKFGGMRRMVRQLDHTALVAIDDTATLPRSVRPRVDAVDLAQWMAQHPRAIDELLARDGALLFRGFALPNARDFAAVAAAAGGEPFAYVERTTPRVEVGERIYTSTEYPATETIPLHNESSYASRWPSRLLFYCEEPATSGGATTLADSRAVLRALPPSLVESFTRRGVLYVRHFGAGVGLSWRETFQTDDRSRVEDYCRAHGYAFEWRGESLRTRRVAPAIATHPATGERAWFNHAAFFHPSSLPPSLHAALRAQLPPDELPHQTFYGDGGEIGTSELEAIRAAYAQARIAVAWQRGDVLLVDNMLVAHGREPFAGTRRVLVAMRQSAAA